MILYYTLALAGTIYLSSIFKSFETALISSTLSRSIRDILIIFYLPQFLFFVFLILKVIGFDVKKFDFEGTNDNLGTDTSDEEEFEINISIDGYKTKQRLHRIFREFIYYFKENKFVVMCIIIGLLFFSGVYIYNNTYSNYDKTYAMGSPFIFNDLNISIEDAIVTNLDYNGNIIKKNKYYIVLRVNISNSTGETIFIDYNNFKLMVGDTNINPSVNLSSLFVDFASSDILSSYAPKANRTFALVYEIKKEDVNKNAKLNIYNGSVYEKGKYLSKKILVNIKMKKYDNIKIEGNYRVGELIELKDTFLEDTNLKINSYLISKSYTYKYNECISEKKCEEYTNMIAPPVKDNRYDNKLIILNVDYFQDEEESFTNSENSLYYLSKYFVKFQYKVGDITYIDNGYNATPNNSYNLIVYEVPKNIDEASIIQMLITIRDKQYIVNLKA